MGKKGISRRDFMKKTIQYASAGAVLGGIAGLQEANPLKAEAAGKDFIQFMRDSQDISVEWFLDFLNLAKEKQTDQPTIDKLYTEFRNRGYTEVSKDDVKRILEINSELSDTHKKTFSLLKTKPGSVPMSY